MAARRRMYGDEAVLPRQAILALQPGMRVRVGWSADQSAEGVVEEPPLACLRADEIGVLIRYPSLGVVMREYLHGYRWQVLRGESGSSSGI